MKKKKRNAHTYIYKGEINESVPSETKVVIFASSVKVIRTRAFINCYLLKSIDIPPSVEVIEHSAFDCMSLESINIPPTVKSIANCAFHSCKSLKSVKIPSLITSIDTCTFGYCESLTNIDIPQSVKTIGSRAFTGCTSLIGINIPSSVHTIEAGAFNECKSLTCIDIPSSVEKIGPFAFFDCESLQKVYLSKRCKGKFRMCFPKGAKFIYTWHEVASCILLRELIKRERATPLTLNEGDKIKELLIIQKIISDTSDDIFRNVVEFLYQIDICINDMNLVRRMLCL